MIAEIVNHLWQSTAFALAVGVLAVACRRNQARVRYSLWLAASLKFLVPFTVLITLGGQLDVGLVQRSTAPAVVASTVLRISEPFAETDAVARVSLAGAQTTSWLAWVLLSVWACGLVAITLSRLQAWRRHRAARNARSARTGRRRRLAPHDSRARPARETSDNTGANQGGAGTPEEGLDGHVQGCGQIVAASDVADTADRNCSRRLNPPQQACASAAIPAIVEPRSLPTIWAASSAGRW